MKRIRITRWWAKALFVLACYVVLSGGVEVLNVLGVVGTPRAAISSAMTFPLLLIGARLFRGAEESEEPRAWWRMTSRMRLSLYLAVLFGILSLATTVSAATQNLGGDDASALIIVTINYGLVAALYANSAIHLSFAQAPVSAIAQEGGVRHASRLE